MTSLVLDAGAFIGFERGDASIRAHLDAAHRLGLPVRTSSPVVAQVWRDGARQALIAMLLRSVDVVAPDVAAAKSAGSLCAATGSSDVVDALVAVLATDTGMILTSDPDDLAPLVTAARRRTRIVSI